MHVLILYGLLVHSKMFCGKLKFKIKWEEYSPEHDWEYATEVHAPQQVVDFYQKNPMAPRVGVLVLRKFGLVWFLFLAKPETEWFGLSQDLPNPNLNRLKPFQIILKPFETDLKMWKNSPAF